MVKVIIILCLFLNKVKNKSYMTILEHAIILVLKYMYLCTLYSIVYTCICISFTSTTRFLVMYAYAYNCKD